MKHLTSTPVGDLVFRRHFALGPRFTDLLADWHRHRVTPDLMLSVHPDLPVTRVDAGHHLLVVLGFVLDPRHPARDDREIIEQVMRASHTFEEVLAAFDPLAGRWAAIHVAGDDARIFHDPGGLRQVHHGRDDDGALWCGSTPGLVSRITGSPVDALSRDRLLGDGLLDPDRTHAWPGSGSAFVGISRLLPNHHLDVRTGEVRRFWPSVAIEPVALDTAVAECAATLTGAMGAAVRRYPLALAMTAGLDSRILLAASRALTDQLTFYTFVKPNMSRASPDVWVPRAMLRDAGLHLQLIGVDRVSRGPVVDVLRETFEPFHRSTALCAQAMVDDPPRPDARWVTVNGNMAEVARCSHPRVAMTPESLTRAAKMGSSEFGAEQFAVWLAGAAPAIASTGIDAWELFYWEQRMGGWLATVRSEFDVVEEGVTPYNSRSLLTTMMGVDPVLRRSADHLFHRALIAHLWPQLLDYPVNPPPGLRPRLRPPSRLLPARRAPVA